MADPLEPLLRPIANVLNKNIRETTPARELCARLDDKTIAIRVRDTALAMYFSIEGETLQLKTDSAADPELVITASLLGLVDLMTGGGDQGIRDGTVEMTGDAAVAQAFRDLLGYAKPDIEEELSVLIGDAAAYRLAEIGRGIGNWGREVRKTMGSNIREYLQHESQNVPSRYEVERFTKDVNVLRDNVDRLSARIDRLVWRG